MEESANVQTGRAGQKTTMSKRKGKRGRIVNRPAQASAKPRPEAELTVQAPQEIQVSDIELNFIVQLKECD